MSDKSIGSIKDFTPNFNFIIPKFDIATWHDYMESNFRSIDALFYNLFGINNYSGEWTQLTKYTVGQVLYIGEDIKDGEETTYSGRLVKVLVDHTTDNSEYFNIYYEQHPEYYELFADASTAQKFAQQAQQSAANALQSEQKAKQSETNAKNSENISIQKANEAATSATNAKNSETNAKSSETSALNSKNAAKTSQDAAKVSENNAAQSVITQTNNFNTYNNELIATKNQGLIELENKTDEGLSVLSNASDALTKANITNCITAIPQDIKLSYENGIVKVGVGKVYDGAGNVININSEISRALTPDTQLMLFVGLGGNSIAYVASTFQAFSGDTQPSTSQTSYVWYDTAEKRVKAFVKSVYNADLSLPIGLLDVDGTITTFNVYGTIGKTFFLLPNREGLISNSKNTDGGFNNVKFKTTELQTWNAFTGGRQLRTFTLYWNTETSKFDLGEFGVINDVLDERYYVQKEVPPAGNYQLWYNPDTGIWKYNKSSGWKNCLPVVFFSSIVQNERITSFKQKNVFQAADYQDVPKLATDNTFSGTNTFKNSVILNNNDIYIKSNNSDFDVTSAASKANGIQFQFLDYNDITSGLIENWSYTNGDKYFIMRCYSRITGSEKTSQIGVGIKSDGTAYTIAPTPPSTDNSAQIATTAFVNNFITNLSSTVGSGYVYIGKLLIQWGSLQAIKDTEVTVTFPKPFSNSNYFIGKNIGSLGSGAPSDNRASFYNLTTTSAKTRQEDVFTYARWLAIGQRG